MLAPRSNRAVRLATVTLLAVATLSLLLVWGTLLHRYTLFRSYGSEPYVNHVGASEFVLIPRLAAFGLFASAAALLAALLQRRFIIALLCGVLASSALYAPRLLRTFHERHILVTYEEYIARFYTHETPP